MESPSLDEAYGAARASAVVVPRPGGLVRLTGPQRLWFLQNTLTADVEGVPPGRWVESCFLDPKGKVVAHLRVGVLGEEVLLDVDPPGTGPLVDWFVRYRFRTRVEVEDLSSCRTRFTVLGPRAAALVPEGTVRAEGEEVWFGGRLGELPTADVYGPGLPAPLARLPRADEQLFEVLRVEAGVGRFGVDYGPATLPQEAGLTRAVSVTKGCYVGQEVMARLHFLGHVNRVLRPLRFEGAGDPAGKALLRHGQRVGTVTSAVRSPLRGTVGLGMVRVDVPEGERVAVEGGGEAVVGPVPEGTKVAPTRPRLSG